MTPWTVAHKAPMSMGFPRQQYWNGLPFPSPEGLPDPGIEPTSPALAGRFFTTEPPGKPHFHNEYCAIRVHFLETNFVRYGLKLLNMQSTSGVHWLDFCHLHDSFTYVLWQFMSRRDVSICVCSFIPSLIQTVQLIISGSVFLLFVVLRGGSRNSDEF